MAAIDRYQHLTILFKAFFMFVNFKTYNEAGDTFKQ